MRTRYSIINMLFNIGGQFLTMLLSFINRMVFIRCLSAEYLGVNGLFTDVLSILNFAELGIGTAMVFSMYEPAARDDEQKLARLMNLYKWMYRAVAVSVLLFGLVLLPFLPYLIKGGEGIEHITLIYMIYVLGSASSYLLSYKNSIYQAYQKGYICAGWSMACECIKTVSQITVLLLTRNFILYLAVQQAIQFLPNIMVSRMVDKEFPYLKECHELPEREERNGILKNIGAMSMHKLSTIIVRNTDSLLMSSFIGLATVGLYSNYRLVINALNNLMGKFAVAFSGSIGNFAVMENSDRLYKIYKEMDFMFFVMSAYLTGGLMMLFNPLYHAVVWREILFFDDHRDGHCGRVLHYTNAADESAVPGGHGAVLERPLQSGGGIHHQSGGLAYTGAAVRRDRHYLGHHHQHAVYLCLGRTLHLFKVWRSGCMEEETSGLFCRVSEAHTPYSSGLCGSGAVGAAVPGGQFRYFYSGWAALHSCVRRSDRTVLSWQRRI